MNNTLVSPKWKLIWQDVKSWAITSLLMIAPLAAEQLVELLMKQDYGSYGVVASIVLGSLLKLIQKIIARSHYEVK